MEQRLQAIDAESDSELDEAPRTVSPQIEGASQPVARRGRAWLPAAVLVVGYLLQVAWRLWLSRNLTAPPAHADEDAYLIAARALAGGPGGGTTENPEFRRLGYPMLLAPVYWFTHDPFVVYRAVHVVNAALNALAFPLAYLFARRVGGLSRPWALAGAFVVSVMPAVAFYAQFALTDSVLATLGLCWLLLLHRWLAAGVPRARLLGAAGSGLVAGYFYATHVRGMMVLATHLIFVAGVVVLRRSSVRLALASVGGAVVGAGLDPALKLMIRGEIVTWGRSPTSGTMQTLTSPGGLLRVLGNTDGQLWYLSVATLGVGAVGLIAAALPLRRPRSLRLPPGDVDGRSVDARAIIMLTALVVTALIALTSSAALPAADNRITYYSYPRYIQFLFPVWVLAGLAALKAATPRAAARLFATGAAATLACGAVLYVRINNAPRGARFTTFDVPEVSFLGWRWDAIGVVRPSLVALALGTALVLVVRPPARLAEHRLARPALVGAAVAVALLQLVELQAITTRISEPLAARQYLPDTPLLVRDLGVGPGDRVAVAVNQPTWYVLFNDMREVYWTRLLTFDTRVKGPPDAANVVVAPWGSGKPQVDWDGAQHGFRMIGEDRQHQWAVWRRG
jgi:hypothetical protein